MKESELRDRKCNLKVLRYATAALFFCVIVSEMGTVSGYPGSEKVRVVWSGSDAVTIEFTTLERIQNIILFPSPKSIRQQVQTEKISPRPELVFRDIAVNMPASYGGVSSTSLPPRLFVSTLTETNEDE